MVVGAFPPLYHSEPPHPSAISQHGLALILDGLAGRHLLTGLMGACVSSPLPLITPTDSVDGHSTRDRPKSPRWGLQTNQIGCQIPWSAGLGRGEAKPYPAANT